MVSIRKAKKTGFQLRKRHGGIYDKEKVGLLAAGLCIGFVAVFLYTIAFSEASGETGSLSESLRRKKKHPRLMEQSGEAGGSSKKARFMNDKMNAIALEINEVLNCEQLLKDAEKSLKMTYDGLSGADDFTQKSRRLQEQHGDDGGFANSKGEKVQAKQEDGDDKIPYEKWGNKVDNPEDDFRSSYVTLNAKHLFCLAASENPPKSLIDEIKCDAGNTKRKTLLDLFSSAQAQMQQSGLMKKVLGLATERKIEIMKKTYNIWAPAQNDEGVTYMENTLNSEKDVDNGGLNGMDDALGPGKIFVDMGSCLGLTCLTINDKYPGTTIVSVEPASPNWLLQQINMRCNLPHEEFKAMKIILAGVGANNEEEDNMVAKLMWRPTSTTSARSWTPADDFRVNDGDEEIIATLKKLSLILAEAGVFPPRRIDVMNLDCQGCEYNLIPALNEEEYEEIPTVTGNIHWGLIKSSKLPSSKKGEITHKRLCGHENFARKSKECCAFPNLAVKSSVPGEVLQKSGSKGSPPTEITVSDVIDEGLCDDFDTWSKEHSLNTISDDFNWAELSSKA